MVWEHLGHLAGIYGLWNHLIKREANSGWPPGKFHFRNLYHWSTVSFTHLATELLPLVSFAFILSSQPDWKVSRLEPLFAPPATTAWPKLSMLWLSTYFGCMRVKICTMDCSNIFETSQWEMCSFYSMKCNAWGPGLDMAPFVKKKETIYVITIEI